MGATAVVVLVPEAEPVVATHRLRHDSAAVGVPSHVTILYPFRIVDDSTNALATAICRSFEPFRATFDAVGRFSGEVVWLRPDPSDAFSALIGAFVAAFPDHPPYGGTVPNPIPHLTVADGVEQAVADSLEEVLAPLLPVSTLVDHLTLLVEDDDQRWSVDRSWPLGMTAAQPTTVTPPVRPS